MRLLKQILYGFAFVAFFAIIFSFAYSMFFAKAPSCFDNKQNEKETGVDCGGPCVSCGIKNLKSINVLSVSLFKSSNGIGVVASLQNPNVGWGAKDFSYAIDIKNNLGETIKEIKGSSFVYAGELKYIVIPYIGVNLSNASNANIIIKNPRWVEMNSFKKPDIEILDTRTMRDDNGFVKVTGTASNKDEVDYSNVNIIALLYSHKGNLISASKTFANTIQKFNSYNFSITFPKSLKFYKAPAFNLSDYFPEDLKLGDTGANVKKLQIFLNEMGVSNTTPTGSYSKNTMSAVKEMQKKLGINQTGILDSETRQKLTNMASSTVAQNTDMQNENNIDISKTKIFAEAKRDTQ